MKQEEDFEIKPSFIYGQKDAITTPTKKSEHKSVNATNSAFKDGPSQEMIAHERKMIHELQQKQMIEQY